VARVGVLAAVAAVLSAFAGTAQAGLVAQPRGAHVVLRSAPHGRVIARLGRTTEFGSPLVWSVAARRGRWIGVVAPQRRNGVLSWIDARSVHTWKSSTRIDVSLSRRTLSLVRGGELVMRAPIGVGSSVTPTPTGTFAVTDRLAGADFSTAYGCCILALSGHQERPATSWSGSDTRIAIHAGALGALSNGCIHAPTDALRFLMTHVPLGTRVTIRA
jgi:lipoprotein-anchoring transpeptidase ErfK/SrfK